MLINEENAMDIKKMNKKKRSRYAGRAEGIRLENTMERRRVRVEREEVHRSRYAARTARFKLDGESGHIRYICVCVTGHRPRDILGRVTSLSPSPPRIFCLVFSPSSRRIMSLLFFFSAPSASRPAPSNPLRL